MTNIKIAVATHKEYKMPKDSIYLPVQSGAELSNSDLGFQKDNEGNNISSKNPYYCELTALYWLWKNVDADYKGLVHYRRHFSNNKSVSIFTTGKFKDILDEDTLSEILKNNNIVLPKLRKYYIETIGEHYKHTHHEKDLIVTRNIISKMFPDYIRSFDKVLNRKSAHMFNMFIMKDSYFGEYCDWLFSILFEVEAQLDISSYSTFNQRVFGRLSEILLDVWIDENQFSYEEVPMIFMEKQNWVKKCSAFLAAKFLHKRY